MLPVASIILFSLVGIGFIALKYSARDFRASPGYKSRSLLIHKSKKLYHGNVKRKIRR